jgi:hypothetical protein
MHDPIHTATTITRTQAACLVAAPAVLIVARALMTPFRDQDETSGYLTAIAKDHATSDIGAVLVIVGTLLLIPAFIALGRIARDRMPKLAWVGVGLAIIGSVAMTMVATLALVGAQIARFATPDTRVDLWKKIFNTGTGSAVGQLLLLAGVIGCVLLAIGLYRSGVVPHAAAVLVGLGGTTTMITTGGPVRVVLVAAATLTLAGFSWVLASTRVMATA